MLTWALIFAVIALVAGVFGFGGVASAAAGVARRSALALQRRHGVLALTARCQRHGVAVSMSAGMLV